MSSEVKTPKVTVSCRGIKKSYGEGATKVVALHGVDLDLHEKEVLIIIGPSGSGKTTLISIIGGILNPDEGICRIDHQDLFHLSDEEKTKFRATHVGFVFQAFNLIPMLSSVENVAIPLILNGIPREQALKEAADLLTRVGLGDKLDVSPRNLSGGQQQRVAICRGCIHKPPLVVCDEPTSSLDHETGMKVVAILREIVVEEGGSLVIVTHDPRIQEFGNRIIKLEDGVVVS